MGLISINLDIMSPKKRLFAVSAFFCLTPHHFGQKLWTMTCTRTGVGTARPQQPVTGLSDASSFCHPGGMVENSPAFQRSHAPSISEVRISRFSAVLGAPASCLRGRSRTRRQDAGAPSDESTPEKGEMRASRNWMFSMTTWLQLLPSRPRPSSLVLVLDLLIKDSTYAKS